MPKLLIKRSSFGAAGLACCIPAAVSAQNVGGPPVYAPSLERAFVDTGASLNGNPDLAGVFARDRNVAVADRPHPEYAPLGIPFGTFRIYPSVDSRIRYDSNLFAEDRNKVSDAISDTTLHVEADSMWSQNVLNLFGDVRRRQYFSRETESSTAFKLGADGKVLVDRLTPVTGSVIYQQDIEPRIAVTGNFSSREPIRYSRAEAQGQVTHEFGRLVARATGRYTDLDYRNGTDTLGGLLQQNFRDHTEFRIGGDLDYAVSPAFAPFVTATYKKFDYSLAKQVLAVDRDSSGYEIAGGVDFDLSRLARGRLQVGYLHQDWSDPRIKSVSTASIRARLEYYPSQLITLSALASRDLYDSQLADAPAYLDTSAVVRADYELLRNLILSAEAGYEVANFRGIDRKDRRVTLAAGGTYLVSRHVTLRFQYIHLDQQSRGTRASLDYDNDRAYLSLALAI